MKLNQKVKLKKKTLKQLEAIAYECHLRAGRLERIDAEGSFFLDMLLVKGFPYKAKVVGINPGKDPYYEVRFTFRKDLTTSSWFEAKDLVKENK